MGYIESKAADSTEAAKYNSDRAAVAHWNDIQNAKRAEAGRVLNQGAPQPVAGLAAQYASGTSPEDEYRLALANQVTQNNAVNGMIDRNRVYNTNLKESEMGLRNGGSINADQMNAIRDYKQSIDPGLAAKWMADREAFR